jgi:hypothetical protein
MENKEYTVTIPVEDYKELIQAQNELDNLINYIFGLYDYNGMDMYFDEQALYLLTIYLKNIWSYTYYKTFTKLKNDYDKEKAIKIE